MNQWPLRYVVVATALLGLVACGGGSDAAPTELPLSPLVAPGTWAVIGSSSAAGAGAGSGQAWVVQLQSAVQGRGVQISNLARGGTTTYQGLPASAAPVPGRPAPDVAFNIDAALSGTSKLVLVSYPSNDTALDYAVDETLRNLLTIRAEALARGASVVLLSTQPRALTPAQLAQMPEIDSGLRAAAGDCFVELREALAGSDGRLAPAYDSGDGVHPNDAGHALIFQRVRALIDGGRCVRLGSS